MSVLIVEDELRIADFLKRGLQAEGHNPSAIGNAEDAWLLLQSHRFDLIVLDVMLPGMSGIELCQRLRVARIDTPILMLTALDGVKDRVAGLRCGADDYLSKPFSFEELLARVDALLRRPSHIKMHDSILSMLDLQLDTDRMQAQRAGVNIQLTAKELALLELFMNAPGRLLSRERILANVWGTFEDPLTNVVDVYVRRLRSKIDDGHEVQLIKTVRGLGYKISVD